jgi:hypothetical protein
MATVRFLSNPSPGLRVYGYSLGGTGTIDPAGYPATQLFELLHTAEITGLEGSFYFITKGTDNKKEADIVGVPMVDEAVTIDVTKDSSSSGGAAINDLIRAFNDRTPITFMFPSATVPATKTKSINGASAIPCAGAVTPVNNGLDGNWYQLAFDEADRPNEGNVLYTFTDGVKTVLVLLTITGPVEIVPR